MKWAADLAYLSARHPIAVICLVVALALFRSMLGRLWRVPLLERLVGQGDRPRVRRKRFLTRVEHETLGYLETAFPEFRVHCQVSMGALISPERFLNRQDALSTHRLYAQKIIDYVLQDRCSGEVIALVELDDWTHQRRRDHARDVLTQTAGYRTIRLPASHRPTLRSVHEAIFGALA